MTAVHQQLAPPAQRHRHLPAQSAQPARLPARNPDERRDHSDPKADRINRTDATGDEVLRARRQRFRARLCQQLNDLMYSRPDLAGVHGTADVVSEGLLWTA